MDNETKDFLEKMFSHMNNRFDKVDEAINNLNESQQEIKALVTDLDPRNANRHIEITNKLNEVSEKVDLLRQDLNKVEVVTSQNSFEIQYLKAVK